MKNASASWIVTIIAIFIVQGSSARITSDVGIDADKTPTVASLNESAELAISTSQWGRFSTNLTKALKSSNSNVQDMAMRYVIRYTDRLDVSDAVFNVMQIYRDDSDVRRRQMAVVALGKMQSQWAIRFLERSELFEKSEIVARTIRAVIAEYNA